MLSTACLLLIQVPGLTGLGTLREAAAAQNSSADPSGGNSDHGHFPETLADGRRVLLRADGAGRITRLWSANPAGVLRIELDGTQGPVFEGPFASLFDGSHPPFVPPLSGYAGGGFQSLVPIPFQRGVLVTATPTTPGSDAGLYWQVGYERRTAETVRESFAVPPGPLLRAELDALLAGRREATGERTVEYLDRTLRTRTWFESLCGPGEILDLRLRAAPAHARQWREVRIRIHFEDQQRPAVDVPLGDFFGRAFGDEIHTQAVGSEGGWRAVRWPMPFAHKAYVELRQDRTPPEPLRFDLRITWRPLAQAPRPMAWFHAEWRRTFTTREAPVPVLLARGRGHFVGLLLAAQGTAATGLSFLEGDERITVDEEPTPRWLGTGTEDLFSGGWYFRGGPFDRPFHAVALVREEEARVVVARHFVADPIPFRSAFRLELEHGGGNDAPGCDYATTACYYLDRPEGPEQATPDLPRGEPISIRRPLLEAEDLPGAEALVRFPTEHEQDYGNAAFVQCTDEHVFLLPTEPGWFLLAARLVRCAEPGACRIRVGGIDRTAGPERGEAPAGWTPLGLLEGTGRSMPLRVSVMTDEVPLQVRRRPVGIDAFRLEPYLDFLRDWWLLGPFDGADGKGLDRDFGPEHAGLRFDQDYAVLGAGRIGRPFPSAWPGAADGYVDLLRPLGSCRQVVVYAATTLRVAAERDALLLLGSDDGCKVFLDGAEVHRHPLVRGAAPDQDQVKLHLTAGEHRLLLKIEQVDGGFGFYARFADPQGITVVPTDPARVLPRGR